MLTHKDYTRPFYTRLTWVYEPPCGRGPLYGCWTTTIDLFGWKYSVTIHDRPTPDLMEEYGEEISTENNEHEKYMVEISRWHDDKERSRKYGGCFYASEAVSFMRGINHATNAVLIDAVCMGEKVDEIYRPNPGMMEDRGTNG